MADEPLQVYLVVAVGSKEQLSLVIAGYKGPNGLTYAGIHSRCITGATVLSVDIVEELPTEIRDDIQEEWEGEGDTPVTEVPMRDIEEEPRK